MTKQITLVSNICLEPYWRIYIEEQFSQLYNKIQTNFLQVDEIKDNAHRLKNVETVCVCLNFDDLYPNLINNVSTGKITLEDVKTDCLLKCKDLYSAIKTHSNAKVIWFGFEDYYCIQDKNYGALLIHDGLIDQLNIDLNDLLKDDSFIDLKRLIATIGIKDAFDIKGKYRWTAPYSKKTINLMVNEVYKQELITSGNTKKCLILDCDNVLWGGILSEDGIEGVKIGSSGLGRPYQDFQRYLLDLYYHGVILAVCSKNEEAEVLNIFKVHTGMLLKEEHIACFRCNWDNKPDNIKDIVESLNIGLDSVVFVDDSIFEIESVRTMLPEVTTILYHRDDIYNKLSCFNLKHKLDLQTIQGRTSTYKTNDLRVALKKTLSYENYISSLEMIIDIHPVKSSELARISELTQRTNKCTNGTRYTLDKLKTIITKNTYQLYTVTLSDKFSELGIVGAIGLNQNKLDLFTLSCRALGRNVEKHMINFMLDKKVNDFSFNKTHKNEELYMMLNHSIEKLSR